MKFNSEYNETTLNIQATIIAVAKKEDMDKIKPLLEELSKLMDKINTNDILTDKFCELEINGNAVN